MMTQQSPQAQQFMRERDRRIRANNEEAAYRVNPYRPAHEMLRDGAWRGQPCFVIGGGPSLIGFDFERLRGRGRIIVINKGFLKVPFADILFFMDHSSFYTKLKRGIFGQDAIAAWNEFRGLRVFLNLRGRKVEDVYSIRSLGRHGLSRSLRRGLHHGNNSGYGALGLAICLQANPVYLLGYDAGYGKDGRTHWHGGYGHKYPESVFQGFGRDLDKLAQAISRTGYQVFNLNPNSKVKGFPFKKVDEVLANA